MLLLSPIRWWVLSLQGFLNLAFGIFVLVTPQQTTASLVISFAILAMANGLIGLVVALRERHFLQYWWMSIIIGCINLGMGLFILWYQYFISPVSQNLLSVFIGIQALVQGSMGFGVSLEMNRVFKVTGAFLFFGILSVSGGILVLAAPYMPILQLISLIAIYAILAGIGQGLDSLRLKNATR